MDKFTVDRIENEFYLLETEDGNIIEVERSLIKESPLEGDILIKKDSYYYLDKDITNSRKKEIENLIEGMWAD